MARLITREDPFHVHKTLGSLTIIHFIYRFYLATISPNYDMHLTDQDTITIAGLIIHACLSMTSLFFHIPTNRIKTAPMIWPEFRLHSILFAMRSIVVLIANWYNPVLNNYIRPSAVLITLIGADLVTKFYKINPGVTTMRSMPFPENTSKILIKNVNLFYSVSQVFATLNVLVHSHNAIFLTLLPIQLAAFWMTLVRKGFITAKQWHIFYGLSLLLNFAYGITTQGPLLISGSAYRTLGLAFTIGRFGLSINKYVLWIFIIGLTTFAPI